LVWYIIIQTRPCRYDVYVYDFSPQDFDLSNVALKRKFGRDEYEYLSKFQTDIRSEFESLEKPAEFSIDIDFKLGLVKKANDGDIILTQGINGASINIVNVPKDACETHPYRRKEVVEKVNEILGCKKINFYDIDCIIKVYRVKLRPEFYYKGKITGSLAQYSNNFIDWIVKEFHKDASFFTNTRQMSKNIRQQENKMLIDSIVKNKGLS
jgi:hypothetical protein